MLLKPKICWILKETSEFLIRVVFVCSFNAEGIVMRTVQ